MSMEELKTALAERDQALEDRLRELSEQYEEKQAQQKSLDQRLTHLEQRGSGDAGPVGGLKGKTQHSMGRVLEAVSNPRSKGIDGFEAEWHQEFVRKNPVAKERPNAVWVPLHSKAVDYNSESPTSGGSNLVATELRSTEFIDILRQQSVIMQCNPRMLLASDNLDIPKASAGATAYWVSGDGGAITESEQTYTKISMQPKFCAALVKYNYRMGLQADVENIIRADLAAQIAVEIDETAINGSGTGSEPAGLLNSSIQTHTYTSSPKSLYWSDVVALEIALITQKVPLVNCHYITGTTAYNATKTQNRAGTSEPVFLADWMNQGAPTMNGYPLHVTTHLAANSTIFGNFSEFLIATWGAVAIESDPYTNFNTGTVGVRAIFPVDMAVRHAESFVVGS